MTLFQKLSFTVEYVLKNLVRSNVIGRGCSGVVYKVQIPNGETIAVKRLALEEIWATERFFRSRGEDSGFNPT